MPRKKIELTGGYIAEEIDDPSRRHRISVYTEFIEAAPINSPAVWLEGFQSHKMPDGDHVNVNEDGTLEAVQSGILMRRV